MPDHGVRKNFLRRMLVGCGGSEHGSSLSNYSSRAVASGRRRADPATIGAVKTSPDASGRAPHGTYTVEVDYWKNCTPASGRTITKFTC